MLIEMCPFKKAGLFLLLLPSVITAQNLQYSTHSVGTIASSLKGVPKDNRSREVYLKELFTKLGCVEGLLRELDVKREPPNVVCTLPGPEPGVVLIGAHYDSVSVGEGIVDNWSGANLLPYLFYSVAHSPQKHTFVFVGFSAEEKGLLGSSAYLRSLNAEERKNILGMVNLDSLGAGPSKMWLSKADEQMAIELSLVAEHLKLPLTSVNIDQVGTTDSETFMRAKIPAITIHSINEEALAILHSSQDRFTAINLSDYHQTYSLIAAYLSLLDQTSVPREAKAFKLKKKF